MFLKIFNWYLFCCDFDISPRLRAPLYIWGFVVRALRVRALVHRSTSRGHAAACTTPAGARRRPPARRSRSVPARSSSIGTNISMPSFKLFAYSSSPTYVRPVRGCCRCRGAVRASAPARLPRLLPAGRPRRTGRRGTRRCASTETRRRARTHVRARPGKLPR